MHYSSNIPRAEQDVCLLQNKQKSIGYSEILFTSPVFDPDCNLFRLPWYSEK